jgi:hypothetical protein
VSASKTKKRRQQRAKARKRAKAQALLDARVREMMAQSEVAFWRMWHGVTRYGGAQ